MAWIKLKHSEAWVDTSKVWLVKKIGKYSSDPQGLIINGAIISYDEQYYANQEHKQLLKALGIEE